LCVSFNLNIAFLLNKRLLIVRLNKRLLILRLNKRLLIFRLNKRLRIVRLNKRLLIVRFDINLNKVLLGYLIISAELILRKNKSL
jgi:hypothetical protein